MEKNSIKQLLMTSNFFVLNKQLVKSLGIETAFFLTALVEADEMLADDDGWFYQTASTLEEVTGLSNHKQTKCIEQLISLGILLQENKGMPMKRYFKLNYEQVLKFLNASFEKNPNQDLKKFESKNSKNLKPSFQKNLNNKELNINNLDKEITTTNLDNINYIEQNPNEAKESSSSSFENNIIEIKKYLHENIQDIPTCKKIMEQVYNNNLTLERIQEVTCYAKNNGKGLGFIYQAIVENWNLKKETSTNTPKGRGHNINTEAMDKYNSAKVEAEEFRAKKMKLDIYFNSLDKELQDEVNSLAMEKAQAEYGDNFRFMINPCKYKILETMERG